jgi:hypothetical protein
MPITRAIPVIARAEIATTADRVPQAAAHPVGRAVTEIAVDPGGRVRGVRVEIAREEGRVPAGTARREEAAAAMTGGMTTAGMIGRRARRRSRRRRS